MPTAYAPVATKPATITLPNPGEARTAASVDLPLQQVANFAAYLDTKHQQAFAVKNLRTRSPGSSYAGNVRACAYNGTRLVIVGTGGEIQTSIDGHTFTHQVAANSYTGQFNDICWNG